MTRTDVNPRFLLVRHVGIIEILADALPKWGDVLTCNPLHKINLTIGKFVAAGQSLQTVYKCDAAGLQSRRLEMVAAHGTARAPWWPASENAETCLFVET